MKENRNNLNNNVRSGKQSNQKPHNYNEAETSPSNPHTNKNEKPDLKTSNCQQKHLTETTDEKSTEIVDIKEAEKETNREENY